MHLKFWFGIGGRFRNRWEVNT